MSTNVCKVTPDLGELQKMITLYMGKELFLASVLVYEVDNPVLFCLRLRVTQTTGRCVEGSYQLKSGKVTRAMKAQSRKRYCRPPKARSKKGSGNAETPLVIAEQAGRGLDFPIGKQPKFEE
jgi:hypothetical protein